MKDTAEVSFVLSCFVLLKYQLNISETTVVPISEGLIVHTTKYM